MLLFYIIKNQIHIICSRLFYSAFLKKRFRLLGVCVFNLGGSKQKLEALLKVTHVIEKKNNCTAFFTSIGFTQLEIIWEYYRYIRTDLNVSIVTENACIQF